jgi:cytochrome P450
MARIEDFYDPWDPGFVRDPMSRYRPLLSRPPMLLEGAGKLPPSLSQGALPGKPLVLIARYDDVLTVMRDAARFSNHRPPRPGAEGVSDSGLKFYGAANLLFSDPPVHTRLRRLVTRAFSPRRIRDLTPAIKSLVVKMLDAVAAKGSFEVMQDLAWPLPMAVIAEMLGVTREFYDDFHRWSVAIISADSLSSNGSYSTQTREAVVKLREYVSGEIARRRDSQAEDVISVLVRAQEAGDSLTGPEVLAFVLLLLLAGSETTTSLIGNTMQLMTEHPEQFEILRSHPELWTRAIEEILRFEPPVHAVNRYATRDTEVGGTEIPQGSLLHVLLGAANFDPAKFTDPERFDVTRDPNDHVSFGEGIHFCLGAGLSRLEGEIAFPYMFERFPRMRPAVPGHDGRVYSGETSYFMPRRVGSLTMSID